MSSQLAPLATPRFHTKRTPGSLTLGPAVNRLGTALGMPRKRWQRRADDVALELKPDGKLKYHTVLESVPRQAGKTNDVMVMGLHRTLVVPGSRVWYTAQTGQAARERWIKECATPARRTLGSLIKIKEGAGDTRLIVPATDAQFRPMPPTADYLHGEQSDCVIIDEPWAHTPAEGTALLQAVVPTMTTRRDFGLGPQTWFVSTKGTAASSWWHDMLDEAIENPNSGICVIDYGIGPDDDPTDLDLVARCHPSFGEGLDMEGLREAAEKLSPSEFARAYGNVATAGAVSIVTAEELDRVQTMKPLDDGPVHIGVAVSWALDSAAIAAAGTIDGVPAVEIIDARPGTAWAVDAAAALARRADVAAVHIDADGPSGSVAEHLAADVAADDLAPAKVADLVLATEYLLSELKAAEPRLALRADPDLVAELSGAALRPIGDRGRLFSRKRSATSIARVEAAVLALRGVIAAPTRPQPKPRIYT